MTTDQPTQQTSIHWDSGTAYDFFVSYEVLRNPKEYGVRSAWASGMRARVGSDDRAVLDAGLHALKIPTQWIHSLSGPKDVASCLSAIERIPPKERLAVLSCCPSDLSECSPREKRLREVMRLGQWDEEDVVYLRDLTRKKMPKHRVSREKVEDTLSAWAEAEAFGERYLHALRVYQDAFFAEEEKRIAPKLDLALERAQARAEALSSIDLIEEISQGIRYDEIPNLKEITLVPSFWASPLVMIAAISPGREIWTFGARDASESLVPGELVPDSLRIGLKTLADPTRLRILRYLAKSPHSTAELTKQLRLRMPTVMHHLSALRLAGLISIHVETRERGHRQCFSLRREGLNSTFHALRAFLGTLDGSTNKDESDKEETDEHV